MLDLDGLPGEALVRTGLADLARGRMSLEARTVGLARERMSGLGFEISHSPDDPPADELALYQAIQSAGFDDAFHHYNSLLRELDSFLEAAEGRLRRARSA